MHKGRSDKRVLDDPKCEWYKDLKERDPEPLYILLYHCTVGRIVKSLH